MNIVFLGLPNTGKSLLSKKLAEKLNLLYVDMGDLLRASNDPEIQKIIARGDLVEAHHIIKVLKDHLKDKNDNILFSGVPRNLEQDKEFPYKIDLVVYLYLPEKILFERLEGRRICENCGKIYMLKEIDETIDGVHYHFPAILPKIPGICDICGGKLIKRKDDSPEILKHRIEKFYEETYPLIEKYEKEGKLLKFIPNGSPNEVLKSLINKIQERIKNEN